MKTVTMISMTLLALGLVACDKKPTCDTLADRFCDASAPNCIAARGWIETQGTGDAAARDAACARVLEDPSALAAYLERFESEMTPAPAGAAATPPHRAAPAAKPAPEPMTAKDPVREAGETIEEVGNAAAKTDDAIDKLGGVFDGPNKK